MTAPIVFISRNHVLTSLAELAGATDGAVRLIESSKPRTMVFGAYVDAAGGELCIVHAFPDAEAMAAHFEGSEQRTAAARRLIRTAGFEVFGPAPDPAIEQLRREAAAVDGFVNVYGTSLGGYLRGT